MSEENKQSWFLKHWCTTLLSRLDFALFNTKATKEIPDLSAVTWRNISVFFIVMFASVLCTAFAKRELRETVLDWAIGGSFVFVLTSCILYLKNTLEAFPSTGLKVWRAAFVLIINGLCCSLAIMAVNLAVFFVLFAVVGGIVYFFLVGGIKGASSSGKSKRKWKLDNGDTVTESKGICGESYYDGDSGRSYDRNSDGTFQEK